MLIWWSAIIIYYWCSIINICFFYHYQCWKQFSKSCIVNGNQARSVW